MSRSIIAMTLLLMSLFAHGQEHFVVGVGLHLGQEKVSFANARALVSAAGLNGFRDEVYWHRLEREKGILRLGTDLNELEKLIDWGVESAPALIPLNYGNMLYGGGLVNTPEALSGFLRYADFVTKRYANKVYGFEIWNEWNIGLGRLKGEPRWGDPGQYVNLVKATSPVIKKNAPSAKVICGAIADNDTEWVAAIIALGVLEHCDAFSVHPYVFSNGSRAYPYHAFRWVDRVQAMLKAANGDKEYPVLITELGWPNHVGIGGHTEARTAAYLIQSYFLARSRPWIGGLWWYELIDSGHDVFDKEHRFGLTRTDYQAKPQFLAIKAIAEVVRKGEYRGTGVISGSVDWVRLALPSGREVTALWSREGATVRLSLAWKSSEYRLLWGAEPVASGAHLVVDATFNPVVLEHDAGALGCPDFIDCIAPPKPPKVVNVGE